MNVGALPEVATAYDTVGVYDQDAINGFPVHILTTRPLKSRGKDVTDEAANHAMTGIQLARLRINAARVPSSVGIGGA